MKKVSAEGGHALKRERHLASRGTRAGGQQCRRRCIPKNRPKRGGRGAIWRGRWMAAGANESAEKMSSGHPVYICAPSENDGGTCFYMRLMDLERVINATEGWDQGTFDIHVSVMSPSPCSTRADCFVFFHNQ